MFLESFSATAEWTETVYAINPATCGIWDSDTVRDYFAIASPVVAGDDKTILLGPDVGLFVFSWDKTGHKLGVPTEYAGYGSLGPIALSGRVAVIANTIGGEASAVNIDTGTIVWQLTGGSYVGAAVDGGGTAYVADKDCLEAVRMSDGSEIRPPVCDGSVGWMGMPVIGSQGPSSKAEVCVPASGNLDCTE